VSEQREFLRRWRVTLAALGVLCIGYGVWGVLTGGVETAPADTARWLVGGVLGHDLVLAPLVAAVGWLVGRAVPRVARPIVQGGLLIAGAVALVAVPVLTGRGGHGNSSSNPLDYPRNLLIVLGAIGAATAAAVTIAVLRERRAGGRSVRGS
jgi:hypothetical protein